MIQIAISARMVNPAIGPTICPVLNDIPADTWLTVCAAIIGASITSHEHRKGHEVAQWGAAENQRARKERRRHNNRKIKRIRE